MTIVLISMEVGCQKMMTKKEEDDDDKDNKAENDNSSSSTLQTPCVASRGGSNNINWVEEEVGRGSECDTEMVKSIKCVLAEW